MRVSLATSARLVQATFRVGPASPKLPAIAPTK
jgi:hypothetical protein